MTAIGYIRQSRRADLDVALSHDAQLAAIRKLAERDGIDPDRVEILSDMGRSGAKGKERLRPAYLDLVARVKDGSVEAVYAVSMSRLARSIVELHKFFDIAKDHGVRLVFDKDRYDLSTASGRLTANVLASVYEFERDLSVDRAKDNVAERRARGQRMGLLPYGSRPGDAPAAVVAAYRKAGSLNGAALALNTAHVPPYRAKEWTGTAIRNVISRYAPDLLPRHTARGVKPSSPFLLYRLLRCACGTFLTASHGRGNRDVTYRCHAADGRPAHHRPYRMVQAAVMPWIMAEAARFRPDWLVERSTAAEAERAILEDQRRAVGDAVVLRAYTPDEAAAKVAAIEAQLAALDDETIVSAVPTIRWTDGPKGPAMATADIAKVLRTYWSAVELDKNMRPVRADWRLPVECLAERASAVG